MVSFNVIHFLSISFCKYFFTSFNRCQQEMNPSTSHELSCRLRYNLHGKVISSSYGWQYYEILSDYVLYKSQEYTMGVHSEYLYGEDCKYLKELKFYAYQHFDHIDILGKTIVRGWIKIFRIPTCIILRARSYEIDMMRSTAYNFQICVPRITYCHSKRRFVYYYYEWYLPTDFIGGMNWDMLFYGPKTTRWW